MMPVTVIEAMLYGGTSIYCLIGILVQGMGMVAGK